MQCESEAKVAASQFEIGDIKAECSGGGGARSGRHSAAAGTAGPAAAAAAGGGDLISLHTVAWAGGDTEEECPICLVEQDATSLSLAGCGHTYHRACLEALLRSSARTYIECPKCKRVYGERRGNMPTSGTISHTLSPAQLPGHQGAGSIEITFNFRPGVQVSVQNCRVRPSRPSISPVLMVAGPRAPRPRPALPRPLLPPARLAAGHQGGADGAARDLPRLGPEDHVHRRHVSPAASWYDASVVLSCL